MVVTDLYCCHPRLEGDLLRSLHMTEEEGGRLEFRAQFTARQEGVQPLWCIEVRNTAFVVLVFVVFICVVFVFDVFNLAVFIFVVFIFLSSSKSFLSVLS